MTVSSSNQSDSLQLIGFSLAEQEYAIPIEKIQEIVILGSITRTPQVAEYIEGVSNLRGTIIPIINLRKLFAIESNLINKESRAIVLNVGNRTMGCIVDSVTQVLRIPRSEIQPAPDLVAGESQSFISGFAKLEERLLILLDVDELFDPAKLPQVNQAAMQGELPTGM